MGIWNRLARIYDQIFTPVLNRDLKIIAELGDFQPTDRVLDFGGGTGRVAQVIKNRVARVVAADAAPKMVACAMAKGLEAVQVNGLPTAFPDAGFDKILVIEAFHHLPAQEEHLNEFHRLLKPGGVLLMEEYNAATWIRWFFWAEHFFEATRFYDADKLKALLMRHGFRVDAERRQGFRYFVRAVKV